MLKLDGFLPMLMGRQFKLKIFMASHNSIRGGFPNSFKDNKELEVIDMGHNRMDKHFPSAIAGMHFLRVIALDNKSGFLFRSRRIHPNRQPRCERE